MADNELFPVPDAVAKQAWADEKKYQAMYKRSVDDPEGFWGEQGKRIHWFKPYSQVKEASFGPGDWYHVAAGVEHAARCSVETEEIEFWFAKT